MNIYQGEDKLVTITVKNENDELIDLLNADITQIRCYLHIGSRQFEKFALNLPDPDYPSYCPLVLNGANKFDVLLLRTMTAGMPVGTLNATVVINYTDALFPITGRQDKYLIKNVADVLPEASIPL